MIHNAAFDEIADQFGTLTGSVGAGYTESLIEVFSEFYIKNNYREDYLWGKLCNEYTKLASCSLSDKELFMKRLIEYVKNVRDAGTRDVCSSIQNVIDNMKIPKYRGVMNFHPDLGIFYVVPWALPTITIFDEDGKLQDTIYPKYKPILHNPREGFLSEIDEAKKTEIRKHIPEESESTIEYIAQHSERVEGLQLYLSGEQSGQILESYLSLLKNDKNVFKGSIEGVREMLITKYRSYFQLNKEIENYVVACWAIGTFMFKMFPVFPYLTFIGEKGTNKSGNLVFLASVCWNPTTKLSLPNEAPLFRLMTQSDCTLLIDEIHRQLKDSVRGPILHSLLETGHEKGGRVPRCSDKDINKIEFYNTYCPKAMASRESLETEEKSITIITTKSENTKYAIARKNLESDPELGNIQRGIFNYAILHWEPILKEYQTIQPTARLSGRYFLLWAPILSVCRVAYPNQYDEMLQYCENVAASMHTQGYEIEIVILSWLITHLADIKSSSNSVYLSDIRNDLNLKWQPVQSGLRNLGLIKNSRDTKKGKKYYLHIDKIVKLCEERGIHRDDPTDDPVYEEENTENSFICVCSFVADSLEELHKHESQCREFQDRQAREGGKK